jgi:protein-disulfide isomerase
MKYVLVGLTCVLLVLAFIGGSSYYKSQQAEKFGFLAQKNAELFVRDHSPTLGSDDAKVFIVEFMDPACETCAAFEPILEAARMQGKYWETLELMFETQNIWASHHNYQPERLWDVLPRAGLDIERIKKDMHSPAIAKIIEQDMADVKTLNVQKTPGYFVNGRPLQQFGYRQLAQLIQSELDAQYPIKR